jgi:outer membrane protein TolC
MAAQAGLATAQARYKQARSRLFPNAGLQANKGRSNDLDASLLPEGSTPVDRRTQEVTASLRWNVYNGGADRAEMSATGREIEAAAADLARAQSEAAERIAEAYFEVQRLDRSLAVSSERMAQVTLLVKLVTRQTELGKSSTLDGEQALSSQLDAELTHEGLQAERDAAKIKLDTLAHEKVADFAEFAFDRQPEVFKPSDAGVPGAVLAARERAAAARLRVRNLASTMAPKVDLEVSRLVNNHTTPPPSTIQQRGWSVAVTWDIPLGGENFARRSESISRADAADADVLRAEDAASGELNALAPRIANARRAIVLLDAQVEKTAALVHGSAIQYEAGRRNLQQMIQTRDNYYQVQQRRIDQGGKLLMAQMRQLALVGRLLAAFGIAPPPPPPKPQLPPGQQRWPIPGYDTGM